MSDDRLEVRLVTADRMLWSGQARMVLARTTDGELGILPNHAPLLSVTDDDVVEIRTDEEGTLIAAVEPGFISVASNRVSILAGHAEFAGDIDATAVRRELEEMRGAGGGGDQRAIRHAETRIRAAERAS